MLRWRIILGTILISAIVALAWADVRTDPPGWPLFAFALLAAGLGAQEMVGLVPPQGARPTTWIVVVGAMATVALAGVPLLCRNYPMDLPLGPRGLPLLGLVGGLLLATLDEMQRYEGPGQASERLARTFFSIAYVGLLMAFAVALRGVGGEPRGLWAVVSMIFVVKMSDIGAYTVGRLCGRNKLAPKLSPGKTLEGLLGGLLFAAASSWLFFHVLAPPPEMMDEIAAPRLGWAIYATALTGAGVIGDLAESLLKRDAGRKDSSNWLPGFGGVLDILDSILAAAPVAYLCWAAGIVR